MLNELENTTQSSVVTLGCVMWERAMLHPERCHCCQHRLRILPEGFCVFEGTLKKGTLKKGTLNNGTLNREILNKGTLNKGKLNKGTSETLELR